MSRAVMQQALEALERGETKLRWAAIAALKQALAEPEQNPFGDDAERYARKLHEEREAYKALFTECKPQTTHWEGCEAVHPECKATPRKPLTDEEIDGLRLTTGYAAGLERFTVIVRAIERAHGIGEQHGS